MSTLLCCIAAIGLHLGSAHIDPSEELIKNAPNNFNPGVYVQFKNDLVIGTYRNSIYKQSNYIGYTYNLARFDVGSAKVNAEVVVGFVSGYYNDSIVPIALPSLTTRIGAGNDYYARISYIPKLHITGAHVIHLSIEKRF